MLKNLNKIPPATTIEMPITGSGLLRYSTIVVAGGILFKFFSMTAYGRKALAKIKEEYEADKAKIKEEYDSQVDDYKKLIEVQNEEIDFMLETIDKVCDAIPNKKVKALKKELSNRYGERNND